MNDDHSNREHLINVTDYELDLIQNIINHSAAFDSEFEIITGQSLDKVYALLDQFEKVRRSPSGTITTLRL